MAKIVLFDLGEKGVYGELDKKNFRIPENGFTNAKNFRFDGDRARSMLGNFPIDGTEDPYTPKWVELVQQPLKTWIVYSDLESIRATDGSTDTDISKTATTYAVPESTLWDYTMFESLPVFNPTNDTPQIWSPVDGAQLCVDLPNWPSGYKAQIIRGFKNRLMAFNLDQGGTAFPSKILASHTATPGTFPSSWDVADATKDAVEFSVTAPRDAGIINAAELNGRMYVYTNYTIHQISFRGGGLIFDNSEVISEAGLFARRSLVTVPASAGPMHFYRGETDCYMFNGRTAEPILEQQYRKSLNTAINEENLDKVFAVTYPKFNEVWLCYPEPGADLPTTAMVYNYRYKTVGLRSLYSSGVQAMAAGRITFPLNDFGQPFSDGEYFSDGFGFEGVEGEGVPASSLVEAVPSLGQIYLDNVGGSLYGDSTVTRVLERDGLIYSEINRVGELVSEYEKRLLWGRVWPRISTGTIYVQFGAREDEDGPITWQDPQVFTTDDKYIDPPGSISGRILAIRFTSEQGLTFDLSGFAYNVKTLGI